MNDFDYDVMQKKRIAASAKHRVCGSKSRKCGLPSDHKTAAELRAMNGPATVYQMNMPMNYETFKLMPTDLQQSYLDGLRGRFGVGFSHIGVDLFKMKPSTLDFYANTHGLKKFGRGGKRMTAEDRALWLRWIEQVPEEKCDEPMEIPEEKCDEPVEASIEMIAPFEPVIQTLPCAEDDPLRVSDLTATFTGKFEPEKFLKWVAMLPMPEGKVKIRVEVSGV